MEDLLFLAQRLPYPPTKGDKIRSFNLLRHLAGRYRVHLGCFVDDPADLAHVDTLRDMVESAAILPLDRRVATVRSLSGLATGQALSLGFYRDRRMERWLDALMRKVRPPQGFVFSSQMAQYVTGSRRPARLVCDFCDVDSQKWRQYALRRRFPLRWLYDREGRRLLEFERRAALGADVVLLVSPQERDLFCALAPEAAARTHALENGIDADFFSPERLYPIPSSEGGPMAVFTGAMDYWPNVEAMQWFVAEIMPLLRRRAPNFRLAIVGANPVPAVQALARADGVAVIGRVPDTRPWLAHADVVVAPLLTARGVQNKVLEGMAMARPVVATPAAHEGLDAGPGRHLLVADGAQAFADAVLAAIDGTPRIGAAARSQVVGRYGWAARFAALDRLMAGLP
ncbi:MAG TPA: TIGR03087 family PEP-CTERM/XrtA system glycosyltransferase [Magnetospirillum sp.]|nr:TIGR03087 family PEP-CTERM/XrtA system glycosyltransferase [Magnetospirillum sp.]